jgi:shikimate kinase
MITRHVVIGGMKHCGKSTQAKRLADFWQVPFFDTDTLLEDAYAQVTGMKRTCREIFREEGEGYFRKREAEVIAHLAAEEPPGGRVIALGGGVPTNPFIPEDDLRKLGFFVFLELDEKVAFERVVREGLPPFLEKEADPAAAFSLLYFKRLVFYRHFSECTVALEPADDIETVFGKLVRAIEEA